MSDIVVREARPEDDEAIGELLVRAFVESYERKMPEVQVTERRKQDLRAVAAKRAVAKVWVAERGGQVVGTVSLWPPGAQGSEAWIPGACDLRHLAVDGRHRGGAVSKLLVDEAERCARALGAKAICLHVRRGAAGVRQVYERRGYRAEPKGDLDYRPEVYLEALWLPLPTGSQHDHALGG